MNQFRIVIIDPSHFTYPYDHHLAQALARRGHTVHLIGRAFRSEEEQPDRLYRHYALFYGMSERLRSLVVKKIILAVFKGCEHTVNICSVVAFIKKIRPDVVHFQWSPFPLVDRLAVMMLKPIPVVFTAHNATLFHREGTSMVQRFGYASFLRSVRHCIVHVNNTMIQLKKNIDVTKISLIPHGLLFSFCERAPISAKNFFSEETGTKKCIVFFGAIKQYKGIDTLLRAFGALTEDIRNGCQLVIAGQSTEYGKKLSVLADQLGIQASCRFVFRRLSECEVDDVFAKAHCVVFPYDECDMSGAFMRALPFGKPIVATRVGGLEEVFGKNMSEYMCQAGDDQSLSRIMHVLLTDVSAYQKACAQVIDASIAIPEWETIAKMTEECYRYIHDAETTTR